MASLSAGHKARITIPMTPLSTGTSGKYSADLPGILPRDVFLTSRDILYTPREEDSYLTKKYNKLVRDKIPKIIEASGKKAGPHC